MKKGHLRVGSKGWWALAVLLVGGFVTIFDAFVVNVAMPSIQQDLQADFSDLAMVIAGYELALGALLIAGGRLGDRFGRKRVYLLGMLGFGLASGLCGIAVTAWHLIVARLIQGAAAAMLLPQIYALMRVNFDQHASAKAFGLLGMTLGLAAIAGQVLGGWMVEANLLGWGWRSVFLVNLPIALAVLLAGVLIAESKGPQGIGMDWPGILIASTALLALLLPMLKGPALNWPVWTWCSLGLSLLLLYWFVRHQARLRARGQWAVMDLSLLRQPGLAIGTCLVLLIYSAAASLFLCIALLLQQVMGLTPSAAGYAFAPASLAFLLASWVSPKLVRRIGIYAMAIGAGMYALGIGLVIWQVNSAELAALSLLPAFILIGAGQGLCMTPLLNLLLGRLPTELAGMASGWISTMQQVGGAIGVALVGILYADALAQWNGNQGQAFAQAMLFNLCATSLASIMFLRMAWHSRQQRLASAVQDAG